MSTMLIEDIMPLVTNQDDYLKYYMDESLPLFDKINIIIKKGESMQRQALINNLNSFVHDSLFSNLIQFIISDIGTWEAETINIFPKSLYNIIINNKLDNELFNIIFKHIIINITTGADETKTEYNIYFDKIIEYYRPTKTSYEIYNNININIDKEFPYKLNNNIFEFILSLGKFGQSPINRRLCCYLCSSLCRLLLNKDNDKNITTDENIFKMYQRLGFLFEDPEKIIEVQMVRELQYIIPLFKSIMFNNKDIIKSIECYIKLNFENLAQSMCIICLLNNIIIIKDQEDLCNLLIKQIKEIIEDDKDYEINFKNDIMECLINCLYNNYKFISDIVKQVFDLGIIEYYINNLYSIETLNIYLKNFDKIYFLKNNLDETDSDNNSECNNNTCNTNSINLINICINNSNANNTNINNICQTFTQSIEIKNQSKIIFEELFINIYNKLYNKVESTESSSNNLINITKNDLKDLSEENKKLLFKYLSNILKCIFSYNKFNKQISDILFDLLKKESIINILTYYCKEENENEKYYIKKKNKLYKLLHFFVKNNHRKYINNINNNNNNNNINSYKEFILDNNNIYNKLLILILNNIFSIIEELQKPCNSDQCLLVSNTLYQLIPKLYKYYKNIVIIVHNNNNMNYIITNNQVKENNNDNRIYYLEKLYEDIFNKILSIIILNQKIGFYIKNEYIKIIPLLILYSSNRNKYLQFIRKHILNSDNFFLRKFSLTFIEACLSHYSFNFIKKTNIYDDIIILMKDNVNIISTGTINIIYKYIKKIIRYSHGVFQELCEEIKDIYNINIQKFNHDIKNFDKEKNIIINKILNINDSNELEEFFNKDDIIKIKEIENKFIILENDIFNFELNFHKIKNQKKNGGGDIENNKNNHEITRSIFQRVSSTSTSFQALTGLTNHIPFNQRLNTKKNSLTDKSSNILKSLTSKNISNNKLYLPKIKAKRKDSNCSNGNNNNNINSNIYVIKPKISEKDIIMAKNKKLLPFSKNRTPSAKTLKKNNNNSPINNNNSNINTNNNCEEFNFKARSNKKSISNKNINFFVKPNIKGNIQGNNKIYINAAEKINTSVTSSK